MLPFFFFWLFDLLLANILLIALFSIYAEFDALTGSKISALDIGAPVVRMSYSPTSGHTVIAILQVGPIELLLFAYVDMNVVYNNIFY